MSLYFIINSLKYLGAEANGLASQICLDTDCSLTCAIKVIMYPDIPELGDVNNLNRPKM